jgi:hypothetical protein
MFKKTYVFLLSFLLINNAFAQIDGDNIFSTPQIIDVQLTFSQTGYWDSLVLNYATETYMKADLTLTDNTGTYTFNEVGVRLKGNSSYSHPNDKKSFKIDFNKYVAGQNYDGLKKLNLNNGFKDPTLMREKVFFDICREAGVAAPRANFANVTMNGALKGFYAVIEQIDDQFLDWNILDDDGNLFKAGSNFGGGGGGGGGGGTPADLMDYGSAQSSYTARYELKSNETANDWTDLIDFIDFINNSSDADFEANLPNKLELTEYLRSAALDNLFSSLDSYMGSARNYYLYHNETTDKWEWIKWDGNGTFGSYTNVVNTITNLPLNYANNDRPLLNRIFSNPTLYQAYLVEVCDITSNYFNSTHMDAMIDGYKTLIQASVYADNNKMYTNNDFDTNINSNLTGVGPGPVGETIYGLKSLVTAKSSFVSGAINCAAIVNTSEILIINPLIFPNPTQNTTKITWENNTVNTVEVYNVVGKLVFSENTENQSELMLNVSNFQSGVYFVNLKTDNQTITSKLIVRE